MGEGHWKNIQWWVRSQSIEDALAACRELALAGRFDAGISILAHTKQDGQSIPNSELLTALEDMSQNIGLTDFAKRDVGSLHYYLGQVFDLLNGADESLNEKIALLEWKLLPLLQHSGRGFQALHRYIEKNPGIFAELVSFAYKPDDHATSGVKQELTENEKALAEASYRFLSEWDGFPFLKEGKVNSPEFKKWFLDSAAELSKKKRVSMGYNQLGHILARSPIGSDGQWPHEVVRELIDETANEDLDSGFTLEVYNSRGVVSKSLGEGGKQERDLADRYSGYSQALLHPFPRASKLLSEIAKRYQAEAKREDVRSEEFD